MTISYHRLYKNSNRRVRPNRFLEAPADPRRQRNRRRLALGLVGVVSLPLLWILLRPAAAPGVSASPQPVAKKAAVEKIATDKTGAENGAVAPDTGEKTVAAAPVTPPVSAEVARLRARNAALAGRIRSLAPQGEYLVIDTAGNKVTLRQGEEVRAEMLASCGSGNVLEDPTSGRRWVFDTPRGQFRIQNKIVNPLWMKPDWAFIEEGEAIPKKLADRAAPGMMGDYALGIGNGYFIHGTLYTRLLGRNVSHGCVRLGDKDLERLYRTLPIGAQVIIF